jgi:DNA-directed RNA polymerase subunit RPC12/RpoP
VPDELVGELRYYVCPTCGHEVAFARELPGRCL